ncbi:MAG: hypothetical protein JO147_03265 [Actinobacteria bacterium]|nr:hypothetical protein [Actinomycetota bacterium]
MRVVAIDGGAASGKSTLADAVCAARPGSALVRTDELMDGWGDQLGYWARLRGEVLEPLRRSGRADVPHYDWVRGGFGATIELLAPELLLVEGFGSIAACAEAADLRVFVDVPRVERERRWIVRDGRWQPEWTSWLDLEDLVWLTERPAADVVVPQEVGTAAALAVILRRLDSASRARWTP